MVFGCKKRKNVHINVDRDFFDRFIENPRRAMQKKLGVTVTVPGLTKLFAKKGKMKLPKNFKAGDLNV